MRAVCERMAAGELVKDASKAEGVDPRRIREWALEDEFAPLYARARELQAHAVAEQVMALAAEATPANYNAIRVQVDAAKWMAAKLAPKHYSDRQQVEHSGKEGGEIAIRVIREPRASVLDD